MPQGASTLQLYEQATNLLEGSAEICRPCSLLMTCKWTLIFIPCIQHPWLSNKYGEGTSTAETDGHRTHLPVSSSLLQDLPFTAHRR